MESKRRKIFKAKIKNIVSVQDTEKRNLQNKNTCQKVRNDSRKKISTKRPSSSDSDLGVTLLGSRSYHEQNKDLQILQPTPIENRKRVKRKLFNDMQIETPKILESDDNIHENKENALEEGYIISEGKDNPTDQFTQKKTKAELKEITQTGGKSIEKVSGQDEKDEVLHNMFEINIEIEPEAEDENMDIDKISSEKQSQEVQNSTNEKSDKQETNERLTPSIREEIPEREMDELRKSLEEDANSEEINLSTLDDNLAAPEKGENTVIPSDRKVDDIPAPVKDIDTESLERNNKADPGNYYHETDFETIDVITPEFDTGVAQPEKDRVVAVPEIVDDVVPPKKTAKKNSRKATINKNYVDFLSDEEDFIWDSTSWKDTDEESSSSELDSQEKKRKDKKKTSNEGVVGEDGLKKRKINKKKLNKAAKSSGKEYKKKDGSIIRARELQPNPCLGKKCGNDCDKVSEEKIKNIFDHYWSLSAERKKDWLVGMSAKKEIKRKRSKDSTLRTQTFDYFINDGEGRRKVCQQFILKTLDVTQRYVYYTLSNASFGSAKCDQRGKTVPSNRTSEAVKASAVNFIKKLPALPSHYSRKDSTRLYLPVEMKNIKNLYRIYKEEQISQGVDVVSEKIFRAIFNNDFNLGFHVPKKDKCVKCMRFEGQDISQNVEMKNHMEEKEFSKQRLTCHREIAKKNPSVLCTSFDLQKVLNTPYGNSMLLFYSRKYTVYNLCFYESVTRNGFCYLWGESEGKRGGNEIATILHKYIDTCDQRGTVKTLILYSDSCPGQNKNKIVLAAVHNALLYSKNLETIQMNYLLPGHTEMTVDSIHSTIESSVRNTIVWAPSQWLTICQVARKDPGPYNVEGLDHEDFKNYEEFSEKYFKGNLVGKISKIRVATFKKSAPSVMKVKYTMNSNAPEESIAIMAKPKSLNPKYKSSLPITKAKYNDLKKLCDTGVISKNFRSEYLNLSYNNGKDELIDTDIEDEIEETD